eukprot:TRINITY_DN4988_c0_g1_i6.p1 TRINITY_DN4988_c0_g1~~TRINITY_DN4988_c0_g1_i6.p1  ORF type:complete len:397 (+),score=41.64 TRINITY_DN4988_c0_g1_i6:124-1314(+)
MSLPHAPLLTEMSGTSATFREALSGAQMWGFEQGPRQMWATATLGDPDNQSERKRVRLPSKETGNSRDLEQEGGEQTEQTYKQEMAGGEPGENDAKATLDLCPPVGQWQVGKVAGGKAFLKNEEEGITSGITGTLSHRARSHSPVEEQQSSYGQHGKESSQSEKSKWRQAGQAESEGASKGNEPVSSMAASTVTAKGLLAEEYAVVQQHFPQHMGRCLANRRFRIVLLAAVVLQFGDEWRICLTRRQGKGFRLQLPSSSLEAECVTSSDTLEITGRNTRYCLGLGPDALLRVPHGYSEPLRLCEEQKDGTIHMALIHLFIALNVSFAQTTYTHEGTCVSWCRADALFPVVRDVPQKFSATFPRVLRCLELLRQHPMDGWPLANLLWMDTVALDVLG